MQKLLSWFKPLPPAPQIEDAEQVAKMYKYWRIRTFLALYIGYCAFYVTRKNLTPALHVFSENLGIGMVDLGIISATFSVTYGVGKLFAGILADKANVREHFQLEREVELLAFFAVFGKARRLARRRCEMLVAPAASSAVREHERLASAHVLDEAPRFGVAYDGAVGDGDYQVGRVRAVEFLRAAVAAVLRDEFFARAEIEERVFALVDDENDVAAVAAVAARRPAVRYVLLAVERDAPVAAVARLYVYFDVIVKICHVFTYSLPNMILIIFIME